ncbi:hypothetical protein ACHAQA_007094 [Verticillium albo-atrum]
MWPRPDVELLGTRYRRIPFAAIGRDIYFDSRLIIDKLEELYPGPGALGAQQPAQRAVQFLLQDWSESSVLLPAVSTLPLDMPTFGPEFVKDRMDLWGLDFRAEARAHARPGALAEMRRHYALLEDMLKDGRTWILATSSITLADIHACFILDFLTNVPSCLSDEFFNAEIFPLTFSYLARYQDQEPFRRAAAAGPSSVLTGAEAAATIQQAELFEKNNVVEPDPTGLLASQDVKVWRNDDLTSSTKHIDSGKLLGLSAKEIVISGTTSLGAEVHFHYPRKNFTVRGSRST